MFTKLKEKIIIAYIKRWLKKNKDTEGGKMVFFICTRLFWLAAFIIKNSGIGVGIIEQTIKLAASIAHVTKTTRDDAWVQRVEDWFDEYQGKIYSVAEAITVWYSEIFGK